MTTHFATTKYDGSNYINKRYYGGGGTDVFVYWAGNYYTNPSVVGTSPNQYDIGGGIIVYDGASFSNVRPDGSTDPGGSSPSYSSEYFAIGLVTNEVNSAVGNVIYGSDFNAVRAKINGVLGDGAGYGGALAGYGYNQTLGSSTVSPTDIISYSQWQGLVNDANKCYYHQNGTNWPYFSTAYGAQGTEVAYADLQNLNTLADTLLDNATTIAANQITQTLLQSVVGASSWSSTNSAVVGCNFNSYTDMWTYFNQGGTFKITGAGPTGTSLQDIDWQDQLAALNYTVTYADFEKIWSYRNNKFPSVKLFGHSGGYVRYTMNMLSLYGSYSSNRLSFSVYLNDAHVATGAGPDTVDAGVTMNVYQLTASGAFTGSAPVSSTVVTSFI